MRNGLLLQFPRHTYQRVLLPFVTGVDEVQAVVQRLDAAADRGSAIAISTAAAGWPLEHDDGQSLRALKKADLILLALSR